jgi:hypothetical protein
VETGPSEWVLLSNLMLFISLFTDSIHLGIDPPDVLKERDGILALQLLELKVDHSVRCQNTLRFRVA